MESSGATGWHKEKRDVVRVSSCKGEIGPVAWIYTENEGARISFGHFAMQSFDVGDNKIFCGPFVICMADDGIGKSPKFPFTSLNFSLASTRRGNF
jgi:hypothetical protein